MSTHTHLDVNTCTRKCAHICTYVMAATYSIKLEILHQTFKGLYSLVSTNHISYQRNRQHRHKLNSIGWPMGVSPTSLLTGPELGCYIQAESPAWNLLSSPKSYFSSWSIPSLTASVSSFTRPHLSLGTFTLIQSAPWAPSPNQPLASS